MTEQGSAYTRLRRALDHGNLVEALASAAELEHVGIVEALELCLLVLDREPRRYAAEMLDRRGLERAGEALIRWAASA